MNPVLSLCLVILLSYLAGSIPTAVIVSKIFFGFDIREKGSGNMGSTNAFRVLGVKWGIFVQIADVLKGLFAVLVIAQLFQTDNLISSDLYENEMIVRIIAGISAVIGHIFSVFVNFKGGKGINTAAGMLLGIAPIDVGVAVGVFMLAVSFTGYISLGSILAAITIPTSLLIRHSFFGLQIPGFQALIYFQVGLSLLLVFAHYSNIKRLIKGTENRFDKLHLLKFKKITKE